MGSPGHRCEREVIELLLMYTWAFHRPPGAHGRQQRGGLDHLRGRQGDRSERGDPADRSYCAPLEDPFRNPQSPPLGACVARILEVAPHRTAASVSRSQIVTKSI